MRELLGRITALDPDAGAALHVITYFDALLEANAGLEASVRAAATLAGCPAGLVAAGNRAQIIRVEADGRRAGGRPCGKRLRLTGSSEGEVWLERGESSADRVDDSRHAQLDSLILERLASTVQVVLDRTRPVGERIEPAALELLLDSSVEAARREEVSARLGLKNREKYVPVVSLSPVLETRLTADLGSLHVAILRPGEPIAANIRVAFGDSGLPTELAYSFDLARLALRLTTPVGEPGPSQICVSEIRGMLSLEDGCYSAIATQEVEQLEQAITAYPWTLSTLFALLDQTSLRAAAATLHVHHSTLHDRVERLDRRLDWNLLTQSGRTRLAVAMALRLFRVNKG